MSGPAAANEAKLPAAATAATSAAAAPMQSCANCGARLSGPYCSQCGQLHEHAIHSVWHFAREFFEDFTHADSRLLQTLRGLVFRPGFLTREFLEGRRARYLPPIRLYLVLSLVFFLIAGILTSYSKPGATQVIVVSPTSGKVASQRLQDASPTSARQVCAAVRQQLPWPDVLGPRAEASCVAAIENGGHGIDESLLHNVPRAMFLFLPLLGLVMKALYRRPRRHYVEHLLFFLHNHALIFLALTVYALLSAILPVPIAWAFGAALWIYVPVYFFVSMLRVYDQGWVATAGKLAALSFVYVVLGGVMLASITLHAMFAS